MSPRNSSRRLLTLGLLAVLSLTFAVGVGGCGSGSGSTGTPPLPAIPTTATDSSNSPSKRSGEGAPDASITKFGAVADGHEKVAVTAAVHSFLTALANQEYAALCGVVTASNRKQLQSFGEGTGGAGDCAKVLKKLLDPAVAGEARKAADAPVESVRIKGETAFALFTPKGGMASYLVMQNEGGWKAISLTPGTPLDPTASP